MSTPAVTLDTTIGGETSNSYVDIPTCDDYWENHWNTSAGSAWLSLTTPQKTNLLMQACRVIDTVRCTSPWERPNYNYRMRYSIKAQQVLTIPLDMDTTKLYWYQRLQFPRNIDVHVTVDNGEIFIPEPVIWAQCEQAVYITQFDYSAIQNRLQGITLEKVSIGKGDIQTTQEYEVHGSSLSPVAKEFLTPFMLRNSKLRRC